MANNIIGMRFPGDAVVSYGALKRAGEAQAKDASLPAVMTLFAIVEAVVLYERLWYAPFGDARLDSVAALPTWTMLQGQELIAPIDAGLVADDASAVQSARERWRRQVRALGEVPAYEHIAPEQLLDNTFQHALEVQAWAYDAASESVEVMTADGLARWQRHVAGIGFDARAEAANDGNDNGRFMDWETTSVYLARAATVDALEADYVGDAFEAPIVRLGAAFARRNLAARLYGKFSEDFQLKIRALMDDGYAATLAIPPIVALALDRSSGGIDTLLREAAALRQEFAPFRARYRTYAETLRNPAGASLGELLDAKREALQEVGAALNKVKAKRTDTRIISEVIGASVKLGEGEDELLEIKPTLSLPALAKFGIEKAALKRIKGRAQILFDSYAKAMGIRNYHALVGKRLGVALTREDDEAYQAYVQAAERIANVDRPAQ
jgi:hypothetical protein